jgi:hypothetical protein
VTVGTATGVNGERSAQAVGAILLQAQRSQENADSCKTSLEHLVPAKDYPAERRQLNKSLIEHQCEAAAYRYAASLAAEILGVEVKPWKPSGQ